MQQHQPSISAAASADARQWTIDLQQIIDEHCSHLQRIVVCDVIDSTQDEVRRLGSQRGDVVTALQQKRGRGRRGKHWSDEHAEGIAVTFVMDVQPADSQRYAIAAAIAVCKMIESITSSSDNELSTTRPAIKWPNDVLIDGRKVAGILIEITDGKALIGVGVNVSQRTFADPDLKRTATSLHLAGLTSITRLDVLKALLPHVDHAVMLSLARLTAEFEQRDFLTGRLVTLRIRGSEFAGVVQRIDPLLGMEVIDQQDGARRWVAAGHTTVLSWAEGKR